MVSNGSNSGSNHGLWGKQSSSAPSKIHQNLTEDNNPLPPHTAPSVKKMLEGAIFLRLDTRPKKCRAVGAGGGLVGFRAE